MFYLYKKNMANIIGLFFIIIIFACVEVSVGDGVIAIRFAEYINPGGKGNNGHCCDGRGSFFCQRNGCDHTFTVCLDDHDNPREIDHCVYGRYQSRKIPNQNIIVFGNEFGGVENPMIFSMFGGPLPNATLKIKVEDDDGSFTSNDFVDYLEQASIMPISGQTVEIILRPRTILKFTVSASCLSNWYGPRCERMCDVDETTRYTCDPQSGEKLCKPGWVGSDCSQRKHTFIDRPNSDCDRLVSRGGVTRSGRYQIHVGHQTPFPVYCQVTNSGEGWTVIQQRRGGRVDFSRSWQEYAQGFGNLVSTSEFWLGLEKIFFLTTQRRYRLKVVLEVRNKRGSMKTVTAHYDNFVIGSANENYTLHTEGPSGEAGDSLAFSGFGGTRNHEGMPFSTSDVDNDMWPDNNCAQVYGSGWWYNDCFWSNLNGEPGCFGASCISWHSYLVTQQGEATVERSAMMILPNPRY